MCRSILSGLLLTLLACASAGSAHAQCAFSHPRSAKKLSASLVQAFYYCGDRGFNGDRAPNTTTEGNVPACSPPFTQAEYDVDHSWRWNELVGLGRLDLKAASTFPSDPLNPPGNSADVTVLLKMKGIVDSTGFPVDGRSGNLFILARITMDDRAHGDMTTLDFPASTPFDVVQGKVKLKTSMDVMLNAVPHPGLPTCTSVEIVAVGVNDDTGALFASAGLFLKR